MNYKHIVFSLFTRFEKLNNIVINNITYIIYTV